jgi:hypothetical protein
LWGPGLSIIAATRHKGADGLESCYEAFRRISACDEIERYIVVCDLDKPENKTIGNVSVEFIYDPDPIRPCAFNRVLEQIRKDSKRSHLYCFSKEVEVEAEHIRALILQIGPSVLVAGYRLKDNILTPDELRVFSNTIEEQPTVSGRVGLAYRVPWNTCAIWHADVVFPPPSNEGLWFDELAERRGNQLGLLSLTIEDTLVQTYYEGMEDGLAMARLLSVTDPRCYQCLLCDYKSEPVEWKLSGKRTLKHKVKMCRKNLVLAALMNIRGYSADTLREHCAYLNIG